MNINEAIAARSIDKPCITRKAWRYSNDFGVNDAPIKVLPTDTPDCCIITSAASKFPCRGWQPKAEDLIANDWFVVS